MKKNIIITLYLFSVTFAMSQDIIKYGDPRYMFNKRHHVLLYERNSYWMTYDGVETEIAQLNDTSGMLYTPIMGGFGGSDDTTVVVAYVSYGYYTNKPTKIYGISAPLIHRYWAYPADFKIAALFQMNNGQLQNLYRSDTVTQRKLFLHEGDYFPNPASGFQDTIYVGRHSTLTYTYEYYFDSAITVHDTFFVGITCSSKWMTPTYIQVKHILHYDSVGYPPNPDDAFSYNDFHSQGYIYEYANTIFARLSSSDFMYWDMVFPIIMPHDSLGVLEIGAEPVVSLAPNPASGSTTLTADVPVSRLLMHNVDGRLVRELKPEATQVEINLAGLPGGLYIISAVTPRGTAHRKLLVR